MTRPPFTTAAILLPLIALTAHAQPTAFFEKHCCECHGAAEKKGGLDLTALEVEPANPENFARWLKIHDRIESSEMPPRKKNRPATTETAAALQSLHALL